MLNHQESAKEADLASITQYQSQSQQSSTTTTNLFHASGGKSAPRRPNTTLACADGLTQMTENESLWPDSSKKWLWACHACPKPAGWLDANQWTNLGYPGPISRVHYPTSGNID